MDYIIADMVLMCDKLQKFDKNYSIKFNTLKNQTKCDIYSPICREIIKKYLVNDIE